MIVVDLGCADRGGYPSLQSLAEAYQPDLIYGFDPSEDLDLTISQAGGVPVQLTRSAAWLYDGTVQFWENRNGSSVCAGQGEVPCFDFSKWLKDVGPCVVKMDVEGAEYDLIERMVDDGTDLLVDELLVEWHKGTPLVLTQKLRCPWREWWM